MPKGDEKLRPQERLKLRKEFQRVYEEGKAFRTERVVLYMLEREDLSRKAGFVAGKKVGGAVERARAKRLLRESYRRLKKHLKAQGAHLVFTVRVPGKGLSYELVRSDMERLLKDAGLT